MFLNCAITIGKAFGEEEAAYRYLAAFTGTFGTLP